MDNQNQFYGNFDGNGYTISNFKFSTSDSIQNIGIFGYCTGDITDLHIVNPAIDVPNCSYVGGMIGSFNFGSVTDCSVQGGSIQGNNLVGGLVGTLGSYGTIARSYSSALVRGQNHIGGAVGYGDQGFIGDCYSHGEVNGNTYVGGLVGYLNQYAYIFSSYSKGFVTGSTPTGGLVGGNTGQAFRSFWDISTSGQTTSGAGTGLTTNLMQDPNTFISADWDFVGDTSGSEDHWQLCLDGYDYPRLAWEFGGVGDFLRPGRVDHYDLMVLAHDWLSTESLSCVFILLPFIKVLVIF